MPHRKRFEPGTDIAEFTVADYKALVDETRAIVHPPVAAPLEYVNDAIHLSLPEGFYAQLSGSTSPYSFAEKYGTTGGAWTTRVRTGASNAYEVNGTTGLGGKLAWLEPGAPGDYRFQWVAAGAGSGGGGGGGHLPGCFCPDLPATLMMSSCSTTCNSSMFQPCTIQYYTDLSTHLPGHVVGAGYASTTSFPDPVTRDNSPFYYTLGCISNVIRLSRFYPNYSGGGPFQDGILYQWVLGTPNLCGTTVVSLTYGSSFPGSDFACCVAISAGGGASGPCYRTDGGSPSLVC